MPYSLRRSIGLLAIALFLQQVAMAEKGYVRPQLLVEPAALATPEAAKPFVILDARDRKAFDHSRVPGAVWVDATAWSKAFGEGADRKAWARRIGELGIGRTTKTVLYDDKQSLNAGRMWWILRYWGVDDVRLLNGGWLAWQKAKLPIEKGKPRKVAAVEFTPNLQPDRLATKDQLLASLKNKDGLQIVDSRSRAEFCGIDRKENQRGGAIPGAKHLDWVDLIDAKTHRFKPAAELQKLFSKAGIDPSRPTATHCQSGGRASVMAFALELMGGNQVSNYYRSWGEWGNLEDTPIVIPEQPNEAKAGKKAAGEKKPAEKKR